MSSFVATFRRSRAMILGLGAALIGSVILVLAGHPVIAVGVLGLALLLMSLSFWMRFDVILGILLLSVLLIPANLYSLPSIFPFDVEIYRIIVFALFLLWFVSLLSDKKVTLRATPLDIPILFAVIAFGLSFVANMWTFDPAIDFPKSFKALIYVYTFFLLYYLIVSVVRDNKTAMRLVHFIIYIAAFLAVLAMIERLTGYNIFRHLDEFIPILTPSPDVSITEDVRGGVRVTGSAAHPIAFGTLLGLIVPFAIELMFESKRPSERIKWAFFSGLLAVAMLLSVSRTAFVALIAVFIVLMILRPKQRWILGMFGVVAVAALHMFFPGVIGQFLTHLDPQYILSQELSTTESRLSDYPRIMAEFVQKPLVGRGVGTFTPDVFFFVDNQYLKYLVEIGLFGLISMMAFFVSAIVLLIKRGKQISGQAGAIVRAAGVSALVYALVNATFDAQGFPQVPYLFFILLGLGVAVALNSAGNSASDVPSAAAEQKLEPVLVAPSHRSSQSKGKKK